MRIPIVMLLTALYTPFAVAQNQWQGEWITDMGAMTLKQSGNKVTGKYSKDGTVQGTVKGNELSLTYRNGNSSGQAAFKLGDDHASFAGNYQVRGSSGTWNGWRKDPAAESKEQADFSGVWLSTMGTMQLEQNGNRVSGKYGAEGWSTIEGTVTGRRLKLQWNRIRWSGAAWLEQTADGKRVFGLTEGDDPTVWTGIRLTGFEHQPEPKAGDVVEGRADNGMLYFLRMPDGWKTGDKTDVVVLLHGSNWTTKGMVWVTAKNWPEIGQKFAILGIQGQQWAKWSDVDDLRFNYSYVNWMGRSTYQGYPFTDRESPYLVTNVIDELSDWLNFDRVFVGGHSQGGYLTYILHMHFAEKLAGTFPMAGGLVIQAEPDVFEDEDLLAAQRNTPMAIVHGQQDQVVRFSTGQYIYNRFLSHEFPRVKFFNPNLGHPYDFLPVGDVIAWLDVMSTHDPKQLEAFAYEQAAAGNWRDVGAAIARAKEIGGGPEFSKVWNQMEDAAERQADKHLNAIKSNLDSRWLEPFLKWQEDFILSQAAQKPNEAFRQLQQQHDETANDLMKEARQAFRSGNASAGYAKYQEIVDKYYASRHYRTVKTSLDERR